MNNLFWMFMAFLSGAFLPIQAGFNTKLGKVGESAVHASLISFVVGTLALFVYVLLTKQAVSWTGLKSAPAYTWMGGLLGAFYVTVMVLAFPKLGPGLTFGLLIAGQMLISVWLEHINVLVAQPHPITWLRMMGVILVVAGVVIIRKY